MSPRSNQKPSFGQRSTLEKHVTSMSCRLEPAIWSHDTGQQIPYFDRCQLIITWMSDIKEVHGKPRLHVSVNLLLEYGRHVARLHRRRRRRAYAPKSNTASHGTHEKINSWVPFSSLIWVWGSAWRPSAAGAPLLKCYLNPCITHWALALVKGNREPQEAKKTSFDLGGNRTHDLRIRSTVTLPTELQGRTEKAGDDYN